MSQENVDIVRDGFEAQRKGGVEAFLEFIHSDFVGVAPPELALEPDTYVGREGVQRWFDSFYDAVDEVRFEPEEFIDAGDDVVVPARLVVRGHETGIETEQRLTLVMTVRDRRVARMTAYPDTQTALQAIGETQPPG